MKKTMMGVAAFALLISSCSNEEMTDINPSGANTIQFVTTTTRATINDLGAMQSSAEGFKVYAKSPENPSNWVTDIDGTNDYKFGTAWGWSKKAPIWSLDPKNYPMEFYAYYPGTATGFSPNATPATQALTALFTIQNKVLDQTDFLAAIAKPTTKPADGQVALNFKHITSKINFTVTGGAKTIIYVQSVKLVNIKNSGSYNYATSTWNSLATTTTFPYAEYLNAGLRITTSDKEDRVYPLHTELTALTDTEAHLMLLPQTTNSWDPSSRSLASGAYVEVVYRISNSSDSEDIVGYHKASLHPDFVEGVNLENSLYIKVGYPLGSPTFTWDAGKGYTYGLRIGTVDATGGYYTSPYYTDEKGNTTTLPISPNTKIGDPVNDGNVNFKLLVTPWDEFASGIK